MKKNANILFFLLMISCLTTTAQTTYYYKLTKKQVDGVISESVSGGQFITIIKNGDGCYESDKEGYSVNHGRLNYKRTDENGKRIYEGGSYYGNNSILIFMSDFSKFLVMTENGDEYVYTRSTPPAGVTTCSLIRQVRKEDPRKQTPTPVYIPQDNPYQPWTLPPNPTPKAQPQPNPTPNPSLSKWERECSICRGSGTCRPPSAAAIDVIKQFCMGDKKCHQCYGSGVMDGHVCTYCNGSGKCGSCGGTGKCRTCGGTGKIR